MKDIQDLFSHRLAYEYWRSLYSSSKSDINGALKPKSIIQEIEKVENLLANFNEEDSTMRILRQEFLRKKRNLVRELIKAMAESPIDKRFFKGLYQKAFEYLEANDSKKALENDSEMVAFFKNAEKLINKAS